MTVTYESLYSPAYGDIPDSAAAQVILEDALSATSYEMSGYLEMFVAGVLVADSDTTLDFIEGVVDVDRFSQSRRTIQCSFQGTAGDAVSDHFKTYGSLLGMEIHAYVEIDGARFSVGVFSPDEVSHTQDGRSYTIEMDSADRSTIVSINKRAVTYTIEAGVANALAFQQYMQDRYPEVVLVMSGVTGVMPTMTFGIDEDPWDGANRLAQSFGCQTYFDRFGQCVLSPVSDPTTDAIAAEFSDSDLAKYAIIAQPTTRSIMLREIYNGVVVQGEAPWLLFPVCGSKWNTDPSSETYYDPGNPGASSVGPRPLVINDSSVGTVEAATALAESRFNEIVGSGEEVSFAALVDPRRDVGEVYTLEAGDISIDNRIAVDTLQIPLVSTGAMAISGRKM